MRIQDKGYINLLVAIVVTGTVSTVRTRSDLEISAGIHASTAQG